MKREKIIEVLKKHSIFVSDGNYYYSAISDMENIADELQTKEVSDEEIIEAANEAFPYDNEGIPDSHSYSFCQGAEWYREQIK